MPSSCDGCGDDFSLTHALGCCRKGGIITQHHNKIRDALGDALGYWREVACEPILCDEIGDSLGLIADLELREFKSHKSRICFMCEDCCQ